MLEQQRWWANELETEEGMMDMSLPAQWDMSLPADPGPAGSDGVLLRDMARHSVTRDMITRRQVFFPQ